MKKAILAVGIITLFIGMTFVPTVASMQAKTVDTIETISNDKFNRPSWPYFLFGRIKNYEIVEAEGKEYILGMALHIRGIILNLFSKFPNLPFLVNWRWQKFCIPYEGAKIIGPTLLGNYFFIAKGTLGFE